MTTKHPYLDFSFKCGQDWSAMQEQGNNKFCDSCQKTVVDFSKMTNTQALEYFRLNSEQKICGNMSTTQLSELNTRIGMQQSASFSLKSLLLGTGLTIGVAANAQERLPILFENENILVELVDDAINPDSTHSNLIRATVVDGNGIPIPYSSVFLPQMNIRKTTDDAGKVEIFYDAHLVGNIQLNAFGFQSDTSLVAAELEDKEIRITMKTEELVLRGEIQRLPVSIGSIEVVSKSQRAKYKIKNFFRFQWLKSNKND